MEKTYYSHAKINILLRVTGRLPNGYHELRSVFWKISLRDTLIFRPNDTGKVTIICDDPQLPGDSRNIAFKAAETLLYHARPNQGVDISLLKDIPVAAGLGGGSSNAAVTLTALNELWGLGLSQEKLSEIGLAIGADVPFFLGAACAWAEGVGEILTPLNPRKSVPLVLAKPSFGIPSASAYRGSKFDFTPCERDPVIIGDIESGDPVRVARHLANDLMPWALATYPELAVLKRKMETVTPAPLGVLMSGSGSTIFSIYATLEQARDAADKLAGETEFVTVTQTIV